MLYHELLECSQDITLFMCLSSVQIIFSVMVSTLEVPNLFYYILFYRDSEKLPSCKKPLSPVKDNIQLTPETEEEIFNKPECAHVQRAIF